MCPKFNSLTYSRRDGPRHSPAGHRERMPTAGPTAAPSEGAAANPRELPMLHILTNRKAFREAPRPVLPSNEAAQPPLVEVLADQNAAAGTPRRGTAGPDRAVATSPSSSPAPFVRRIPTANHWFAIPADHSERPSRCNHCIPPVSLGTADRAIPTPERPSKGRVVPRGRSGSASLASNRCVPSLVRSTNCH